jgi:DNA-binding MarR family transcriptional regulator
MGSVLVTPHGMSRAHFAAEQVALTARGRRIYEQILPRFQERQERMVAPLSGSERAELNRLLNKRVERDDDWAQAF